MVWDYSKLRGRIRELYGSEENFADVIGIARSTLSLGLNNKRQFTHAEIVATMDAFNEPLDNVSQYFFTLKV